MRTPSSARMLSHAGFDAYSPNGPNPVTRSVRTDAGSLDRAQPAAHASNPTAARARSGRESGPGRSASAMRRPAYGRREPLRNEVRDLAAHAVERPDRGREAEVVGEHLGDLAAH